MSYELIEPEASVYDESDEKNFTVEDAVVMLISIEKGDDGEVAAKAIKETTGFMQKQKRKLLLIYPFAHLSRNLESPREASELLEFMRKTASESCEVIKAPFGWNKKWSIKIKGHPLAEQLKAMLERLKNLDIPKGRIRRVPRKKSPMRLKQEEKVKSTWYILTPEGELVPRADFRREGMRT